MEVRDLIEQIDIVDYISQYVDLEEENGEFWGLSPFKDEKTPSFSVRREKQVFYDFSSGAGGNVIAFAQKIHNCNFHKAIEHLKKFANISENTEIKTERLECAKIAKRFRKAEQKRRESTAKPLQYDYMQRYEFNTEKLQAWVDEGISLETMRTFEVAYDAFSDRIVFPIKNYGGEIINVCGRTLDPDFKTKGLRKYTYFFPLGTLDTLYGISDNIEDVLLKKELIIFEGAKSVLLAHTWGIKNTCALCTSHLNPQQFLFLAKLGVRVVFALDKEIDIKEDRQIQRLKRYVTVDYINDKNNLLDEKMAPVDKGVEVFEMLYNERRRLR